MKVDEEKLIMECRFIYTEIGKKFIPRNEKEMGERSVGTIHGVLF